MASTSALISGSISIVVCPSISKWCPRSVNESLSQIVKVLFKLLFFHWLVLGTIKSVPELSKRGMFLHSILGLSDIISLVFQARHSGDASFWCRSKGPGCLTWGTNPLFLQEKWNSSFFVSMPGVGSFVRPCLCLSYTSECGPFCLCCIEKFI